MKDNFSFKILVVCLLTLGLFHAYACKKENAPPSSGPTAPAIYSEIDTQAVAAKTGIKFSVIKADSQGTDIRYKFLWICFANGTNQDKVEEVVKNILDALIAKFPRTYHSFTLHSARKRGRISVFISSSILSINDRLTRPSSEA